MFIRGFCNYVLWQYLGILKINHNVLWQYLGILKTNQRSTVFGNTYHVNIKQFEIKQFENGQKTIWSTSVFWNVFFERAIILIFDLCLLISVAAADYLFIFAFFICIWLYWYQITFTYLSVFTRLYDLIVKTSDC